jgi:EsV-1-7 cysteine-rich motif
LFGCVFAVHLQWAQLPGMIDVKNKRCEDPGCGKTPNFGEPGKRARFCSTHKLPNHVNVKGDVAAFRFV